MALNKSNAAKCFTHHILYQLGTKSQSFLFATHLLLKFLQLLFIFSSHVQLGLFHVFYLVTQHINLNEELKSK